MTLLLEIAGLAAAAVARDIAPPDRSITRTAGKQLLQLVGHHWQDRKALQGPLPPAAPAPKPNPPGPIVMYDSVTVANIPEKATHIACYLNGLYANAGAMRKRFPHATLITITIDAADLLADCIDCETGDATPAQAAGWAVGKIRRGEIPKLYANRSTMPLLWALLQRAGVRRHQVKLWVADWTPEPHIPAPYDACQWHGGTTVPYDESLCLPSFFE